MGPTELGVVNDFVETRSRLSFQSAVCDCGLDMSQLVEIELPDELPAALQREASELGGELRLTAAVKWYELGRLSQGKAAEVANLSRSAFISELARFGVSPFQETAAEILDAARDFPK